MPIFRSIYVVHYCIWCSALGVVAEALRSRCLVLCTVCKFVSDWHLWPVWRKQNLMYVCPCIIYENDERYQLDATILFITIYKSTHSAQDYTPAPQDLSHYTQC